MKYSLTSMTIGAVTAVAALAGVSAFAQSATTSSSAATPTVPTQACIQALTTAEQAKLSTMDAEFAARKTAMQAHNAALSAAATIADDAQRLAAIKKANDDFRTAMQTAMQNQKPDQAMIDAIKTACGTMGHHGFGMGMGMEFGMMGGGHKRFGHGFGMHGGPFRESPVTSDANANTATNNQ